jgi:hypothetical protein
MMQKTRRTADRGRASKIVAWTADNQEDTPPASALQVSRLVRRFALPATLAAVVAEHAFHNGRQA